MNETETIRFPVAGMTCGSCVNRITRAIRCLPGVSKVRIDLRDETATVCREPALVSNAVLGAAVAEAGYEANVDAAVRVVDDDSRGWARRLLGR